MQSNKARLLTRNSPARKGLCDSEWDDSEVCMLDPQSLQCQCPLRRSCRLRALHRRQCPTTSFSRAICRPSELRSRRLQWSRDSLGSDGRLRRAPARLCLPRCPPESLSPSSDVSSTKSRDRVDQTLPGLTFCCTIKLIALEPAAGRSCLSKSGVSKECRFVIRKEAFGLVSNGSVQWMASDLITDTIINNSRSR